MRTAHLRSLLFLAALPLLAQQATPPPIIPVNAQTVDMFSWMTKQLDQLMAVGGGMFVPLAMKWLTITTTLMVLGIGLDLAFAEGAHVDRRVIRRFIIGYAVSLNILLYYNTPIPGFGLNFHELFTVGSRYLAATIDINGVDLLLNKMANIFIHMEKPSIFDVQAITTYFLVLAEMAILSIALFVIIAQSFVYLGMTILLFPLTVPFKGIPHGDQFFWNAITCFVKYALMRVAASAMVYVFGGMTIQYLDQNLHGPNPDYSLAHFGYMLPGMSIVFISGALIIFGVKHFVSDFTTGGANAMGSGSGIVMRLASSII